MKQRYWTLWFIFLSGLALLFTAAVMRVDVQPIGPQQVPVGFATINRAVFEWSGVRWGWYTFTDWLGLVALGVMLVFALAGLVQLWRRRSLRRVDGRILAMGGLYIILFVLYLFFEKAALNCRPVLMPGSDVPEASFPSSHTLLVCVVLGSAVLFLRSHSWVRYSVLVRVAQAVCIVLCGATVVGRLLSGVHWLTDILGGCLYSAALLTGYQAVLCAIHSREKNLLNLS